MKPDSKFWKESASLIVLARSNDTALSNNEANYKALVIQRSVRSSFMPSAMVFPGGKIERSDARDCWLKLYKSLGITDEQLREVSDVQRNKERSLIFKKELESDIEREISLRISAIRETFEEVGLLICKNREQFANKNDVFSNCITSGFDVKFWQHEVHNDHKKFLTLCQNLKVAPDLWSSYEWINWLTPVTIGHQRFNVAFFLVCLNEQPKVSAEVHEVQSCIWDTPQNLMNAHNNEQLWLPIPQYYELSRLSHIKDIKEIANFAKGRNKLGTPVFLPRHYLLADNCMLQILPGDDLYPDNPNYFQMDYDIEEFIDKTHEEMRKIGTRIHRNEVWNLVNMNFFINFPSLNGHLCPLGRYNNISKL